MKNNSKKLKGIKYGVAIGLVGQALTPIAAVATDTESTVELDIVNQKDVDVVLTVGDTSVNVDNFEADLRQELQERNIDSSRVNIQAVETTTINSNDVDAQSIFNSWNNYPNNTGQWKYDAAKKALGTTQNVEWTGFWNKNASEESDYNFKFKTGVFPRNDGDNIGWTFRMKETGTNVYSYYAFIWNGGGKPGHDAGYTETGLYKVVNSKYVAPKYNPVPKGSPALVKLPQATNWTGDVWHDVEIDVKGNRIQIWLDGVKQIDYTDNNNPLMSGGYGPYTYSQQYAYFKDIMINSQSTKNFKDTILQPEWREDTERFVVNLEDKVLADLDSPSASGEILTRLLNEEINYVALGTSTNQQQALDFIKKNNENGTFIENQDYQASVDKVADYIAQKLNENQKKVTAEDPYVLVGEPIKINTTPLDLATNSQTEEYPDGRWKVNHEQTFFENNDGQSNLVGSYLKDVPSVLNKPGKYNLLFENEAVNPESIYAHRRPVANFTMDYVKSTNGAEVSLEDLSYDLDKQSSEDKGISEREWKWKETTDLEWNEGQLPSTLPLGKNYIVQLRVKDYQGTWSAPTTAYVTTDSSVSTKPVANFTVSANELTIYDQLNTVDTSYDPAGKNIMQKEWEVKRGTVSVYKGATPVTNFKTYGAGKYTVSLKVKNEAGIWSDTYSRTINVTEDKSAPEITVSESQGEQPKDIKVSATFSDPGGSGFFGSRYVVSNSNETPTTGWSEWSTEDLTVNLDEIGKYYIHVEAKDTAGNLLKRVLGPYEVKGINYEIVNQKDAQLSWEPIEDADSYRLVLYKLNPETGQFESYSFPRTAYDSNYEVKSLSQGETYKIELYPRYGATLASEPSIESELYVPVAETVAAPKVENIVANAEGEQVKVDWDVFNANGTDVSNYRVQALVQDPVTKEFRKEGFYKAVKSNTITFNNVTAGKVYKFEVTPSLNNAYNDENTGTSNEVTIEETPIADGMGDITEIPQLDISVSGTTATVTWDEFEEVSQYRIQRYVKNTDTGLFVKDGFARTSKTNQYVSEGLTAGKEYKFEVVPRIGYVYDTNKAIEGTVALEAEAPEQTEQVQETVKNAQVVAKGLNTTIHWDPIYVNGQEVTQYRVQRYKYNPDKGIYVTDAYAKTVTGRSLVDTYSKTSGKYRYEITPRTSTLYLNDKKVTIYNVDLVNDDKLKVFFGNAEGQSGTYNVQRFVKGEDGSFAADGEKFTVTSTTFEDTTADPTKEFKYTFEQ